MAKLAAAVALAVTALGAGWSTAASAEVVWLCKPGAEPNPCRESQRTTVYETGGASRVEDAPLPADPPIDCFFVYPTVSGQLGTNADKRRDPELVAIARYQAARFSEHCRVFAPIYRQLTVASIFSGTAEQRATGARIAYGDVLEAWREYLGEHNRGRGFVLIGHSQGTRMLRQLVREEVDPNAEVRRRLVSALLIGNNVLVRRGRPDGGDFANVPACGAPTQTGCVIAYSAFNQPPPDNSRFGRAPATDTSGAGFPAGPDYEVLCTNPGSLAANERVPMTTYLRSEPFPGLIGAALLYMYGGRPPSAPTPWLQPADRYTGRCVTENGANVLMVEPIGSARRLNPSPDANWGLHLADVNLPLGELMSLVATQSQSYLTPPVAPSCLPAQYAVGSRAIGRVRLGATRAGLARRTEVEPDRRSGHAIGWCVAGSDEHRVAAVFADRSARARARLVVSTAPGHRFGALAPGADLADVRRSLRGERRIGPGLYRAGAGGVLFGAGREKITFVGVSERQLSLDLRALRRDLRRARP